MDVAIDRTAANVVAIAVAISAESKMLAVAATATSVHERCCESIIDFGGSSKREHRSRTTILRIDY